MIDVLIFIAILSVLVFVHELGHFIAARRGGIRVEEFGMGLPPRLWGKQIGETLYSINLLPIGGFVRLYGEDATDAEALHHPRSFMAKPPLTKTKVLLAGVSANFLLGFVLLTVLFRLGVPEATRNPIVQEVTVASPAAQAGILPGDIIFSLNGQEINDTEGLSSGIASVGDVPVKLVVLRQGTELPFELTPQNGLIGVLVSNSQEVQYPWQQAWLKGLEAAIVTTGAMVQGLRVFLVDLFSTGQISEQVAGPVGIAQMTGLAADLGYKFLLQFTGILSLNLALINILPFPALDGGRLIFVVWEGLTGRKVNQKMERQAHLVGMLFLLLLIFLVTVQDIKRILG